MKLSLKKIIPLLLVLFCQVFAHGQLINYEELSFSEALEKAKSTKQIIFVQMVSDCEQCNTVADRGLSGNEIVGIFSNFICLKVLPETDDYLDISERYRISPGYPTSLFLNYKGHYLDKMYNRSTSFTGGYIKLAALAMANRENPPVAAFNEKYSSGNYGPVFLEEYILELLEHGFNTDDLLEEYVGRLTIDSLFSENKLRFIMQAAPFIDSKIDKLIRFDRERYNKIFMSFPLSERIKINNRVINKSRKHIKRKTRIT